MLKKIIIIVQKEVYLNQIKNKHPEIYKIKMAKFI